MKKNLQPARIETKPGKTLFGVSADKLKAVNGGGGAIGHGGGNDPLTSGNGAG
jgi:hypothetical protein